MNTKVMLIALLFPLQSFADSDSVYNWGQWSQGIKPAAGAVQSVTPPPAYKPDVNFRPNENSAFERRALVQIAASPVNVPASPNSPAINLRPAGVSAPTSTPADRFTQ